MGTSVRPAEWSNKKIVFVTGKGGVGKSLVAAAIARNEAANGRRTLLAELGESSYYKDFWRLSEVGNVPQRVPGEKFDLALWSGESALREYVLHYLKVERLYKLFFENKVMRSLVNVAPGLAEIAILGKITSGIRKVGPPLDYDVIVVDTFATGHALAMFRAPKGMMEAVKFGPMGHHSREMQQVLQDPKLCAYVIVTLLEELPIVESLELQAALKQDLGVDAVIVGNKILPVPVGASDLQAVKEKAGRGLKEFAGYLTTVLDRQNRFLKQLTKSGVDPVEVPVVFSDRPEELVRETAAAIANQVGH